MSKGSIAKQWGSELKQDLSPQLGADLDCNGKNLAIGTSAGTKIGTAANQLIAFYGDTPVNQPDAVANATGAGDVVAQLNALLARMRELGLIET